MIIARGGGGDRQVLILGLSRENITRLMAGAPIYLTEKSHGQGVPKGWAISILFGDTEGAIAAKLQADGVLAPGCKVHVDPRLNQS